MSRVSIDNRLQKLAQKVLLLALVDLQAETATEMDVPNDENDNHWCIPDFLHLEWMENRKESALVFFRGGDDSNLVLYLKLLEIDIQPPIDPSWLIGNLEKYGKENGTSTDPKELIKRRRDSRQTAYGL